MLKRRHSRLSLKAQTSEVLCGRGSEDLQRAKVVDRENQARSLVWLCYAVVTAALQFRDGHRVWPKNHVPPWRALAQSRFELEPETHAHDGRLWGEAAERRR